MITSKEKLLQKLRERRNTGLEEIEKSVADIINEVRLNKDVALLSYIAKFDKANITSETILTTEAEIQEAFNQVDSSFIELLKRASERIGEFHNKQKLNSWIEPDTNGEILGQIRRPIENAGVYVPGGTAAYPSSVLMNVIPAKVAGVKNIFVATPPQPNGKVPSTTLVAAKIAGATAIYKAGGAHAIAALAYGTETIPKVDKIVGPGNIYVATAKKLVFGSVSIDSVAGPSEILIVADETAKAEYIAADLLSQAEHDELASAILITTSSSLAVAVKEELETQTKNLSRKAIIEKSLANYGAVIVVSDMEEAFELVNFIAPEHLEICTKEPFAHLPKVHNAGAVFLGHYSPEPIGDYMAGPNHVLPTDGTARFFSPLSVDDFVKKSSIISFNRQAFERIGHDVVRFAEAEGLDAHANAMKVRLKK